MSLRIKLLLLSLITLILPWAGCQYAREMETALRAGEEQSLAAVARVMADSLQGRADLLYRGIQVLASPAGTLDLEPVALSGAAVPRRLSRRLARGARCRARPSPTAKTR